MSLNKRCEGQRVTSFIMVTTRYSNQPGFKSWQFPFQIRPTENTGNYPRQTISFGYELQLLFSGVQNLKYKLQRRLSDVLHIYLLVKSSPRYRRITKTSHTLEWYSTDHCQNDLSNLLTPYRAQPRLTRIVFAYPRVSALSNEAGRSRSNQFWSIHPNFSRPHVRQKCWKL